MSEAEQPKDDPRTECVCSHSRAQHSGKGVAKRCTAKIPALGSFGDGKCDCTNFRPRPRGEQ